jgi:CRISPR-associated protein Csd1
MLHVLHEYAKRLPPIEPGLKPKMVRWLLMFSPEGRFLNVQAADASPKSKGRSFQYCPDLSQPEMIAIGGGCRHFLVDSADVISLLAKDGEIDDKLAAKHDFFVNLLKQASSDVPTLEPIAAALSDAAVLENIRADLAEHKAKPMDLTTLAVYNDGKSQIFVESDNWRPWWQSFRARMAENRKSKDESKGSRKKEKSENDAPTLMRCFLSGELVEPLPTHNKIEGLSDVGGLSMGDAFTSFDKDAFCSLGLEQGTNAAMSETMVKTYVTALNDLVRHHSRRMAGVKIIYWFKDKNDPTKELKSGDDPLPQLFGTSDNAADEQDDEPLDESQLARLQKSETLRAESIAGKLLKAIETREQPELENFRYYALTVSANSGRVVVRDWMEGPFIELLEAIKAWFDDLAIINRDGKSIVERHKFPAVLAAPLRDLKDATAPMTSALWHCALKKQRIPYTMMAQTLQQVRNAVLKGDTPLHARYGLLKAFCNRTERIANMKPELNELECDPAYLCGRIMAILANIQQRALPNVGAGIVQRYYAAARFTRAWIETLNFSFRSSMFIVARFTRAWIETVCRLRSCDSNIVARFTRAWIETSWTLLQSLQNDRRPLHAGVD